MSFCSQSNQLLTERLVITMRQTINMLLPQDRMDRQPSEDKTTEEGWMRHQQMRRRKRAKTGWIITREIGQDTEDRTERLDRMSHNNKRHSDEDRMEL